MQIFEDGELARDVRNKINQNFIALESALGDITKQTTGTEASNVFTLDLAVRKSFTISIVDANAKTIAFSNIPNELDFAMPVIIKLVCTTGNIISTYPTGTVWVDGVVPVFIIGKTYYITFMRTSSGWHAMSAGAW